jgi:mRNA interferase MazF
MKQVFYVPERGDLVRISFALQNGRGRRAPRHALVLSPQNYNARTGLALLCPITSRATGYPFEVSLPDDLPLAGVVLADQTTSVDWRAGRAERICSIPPGVLEEALGKLRTVLG